MERIVSDMDGHGIKEPTIIGRRGPTPNGGWRLPTTTATELSTMQSLFLLSNLVTETMRASTTLPLFGGRKLGLCQFRMPPLIQSKAKL
jgi:hypothetical protein